jgi:hypothetical protein
MGSDIGASIFMYRSEIISAQICSSVCNLSKCELCILIPSFNFSKSTKMKIKL